MIQSNDECGIHVEILLFVNSFLSGISFHTFVTLCSDCSQFWSHNLSLSNDLIHLQFKAGTEGQEASEN